MKNTLVGTISCSQASSPYTVPPETTQGVPIKSWTTKQSENGYTLDIETTALEQAINAAQLPCAFHHVALMPDAHMGFGVPIGSVLALEGAISPNAVGVDIGCGMMTFNTGMKIQDIDVGAYLSWIVNHIPHGDGKWFQPSSQVGGSKELSQHRDVMYSILRLNNPSAILAEDITRLQLGTLGGGNHFLELQTDKDDNAYLMVHSGSRGYGAKVAKVFHNKAKEICERYYTRLPTPDLAFLIEDSTEGKEYIQEMETAIRYALFNRSLMLQIARLGLILTTKSNGRFNAFSEEFLLNIPHNYAAKENHFSRNVWVHRKGATLARKGELGIIPGSMCSKSYIVRGLGNPESFNSCSHGAGRRFSRTEATKRVKDGIDAPQSEQLGNVQLTGVAEAFDELGSAYKSIDTVMENQKDLVEIVTELTPVAVLKG